MDNTGYEEFPSRASIVRKIINYLTVSDKSKSGVYGMGGAGKSTLVKEVVNKLLEKKSFEGVVFCNVTAIPDIAKIQKEIMDQVGLEIKEETEDGRSGRLLEKLEEMLGEKKKILFVLDDLWKLLDLKAVGIPSPDQHKGCRMLMTSRDGRVLTDMGCNRNDVLQINLLTEEEVLDHFKKMAGDSFEKNEVLLSTATKVDKACGCLPVAIIPVARALKNKTDLADWDYALGELQKPSPSSLSKVQKEDPTIGEVVHQSIYLSYNLLADDELKSILLLCSQLVNDGSIRELLRYCLGLNMFRRGSVWNVEQEQERICGLVRKLQDSSLLLGRGSTERIALHDVVRVITKAIASEDQHVFTTSPKDERTELPDDKDCTRMWLRSKIVELPQELEYPQLELLHVHSKITADLQVPDDFFKGIQRLQVLSLSNFSFSRVLPSSIQLMKTNLRTLCLEESRLEDTEISIIGELEELEVLSFAKSEIRHLSEAIGKLKKLKILDLSDCYKLEVVPYGVISRLSLLEELYMGNSFSGWKKDAKLASLEEVKQLSHLTNLEIAIPDPRLMVEDLFSQGLKRYRMTIGNCYDWWNESYGTLSKLLRISVYTSIDLGFYGIPTLLNSAEVILLGEMKGVKNMLSEGFPQSKHLKLEKNFKTQYVVDSAKCDPSKAFPALESLFLRDLDSLEEICHGEFRSQPFPSLATIEVTRCDKLKNLLSFSIAQGLIRLKSIEVRDCRSLKWIFGEKDEATTDDKIEFSELRSMVLKGLPQLRKFCCKMQEATNSSRSRRRLLKESTDVSAKSDETVPAEHELASLFDEKDVFPKLENLELEEIDMKTLWHGRLQAVASIQNLRRLIVNGCHSLKFLFTSSMVASLYQLEYLVATDCEEMEEIILTGAASVGEKGTIGEDEIVFSKLETMYLWQLPKLKRCCSGSLIKFPLLTSLSVRACPALKTFVSDSKREDIAVNAAHEEGDLEKDHASTLPLFDEKVSFPSLAELEIDDMENLEKIWGDQLRQGSFRFLSRMEIKNCKRLQNVFASDKCRNFQHLEQFEIAKSGVGATLKLRGSSFFQNKSI